MKVILNQTVPKLGKEGQVVTVADGYARNYLFPRGMAILADKQQLKVLERRRIRLDARAAETKTEAEGLREKVEGKLVRLPGKVGRDQTKLFGAITAQDVADALKAQHNIEVDKKQVGLLQPIKRLGDHAVPLDLHRDVDATITVQVFDPEAPVPVVEAPADEVVEETVEA